MATLQKLRNRAGVLLAGVIGLSLLAFILGDFLNSGSGFLQKNRMEIAQINGKSISYTDFQTRVEQSVENYKTSSGNNNLDEGTYASIRNQVWNSYMNDFVFSDEYDALGIDCPPAELFDMVQGKNIHPQIQQAPVFQNQQTGGFDRNLVIQFLKNLDKDPTGQQKEAWVRFEKELMKDRIYTKYNTLIAKGMYVTRKMVDTELAETERKYAFNYVALRYAMTPDSTIKITDAEVQKYYEENKDKFKQEATRDLAYVAFDILPSQADKDEVLNWINQQKPEFERIENTAQFIAVNGESKFNEQYLGTIDIPDTIRTWAMLAPVGSVYGPYQEGNTWKLAKITDIKDLPDSVKASHILIRPVNGTDFTAAQKTADSIKQAIESGQDFSILAALYGTDGTKDKGGDLDWFTQADMIPEFSTPCFLGKKGDLFTVKTSYGVHVVKITDQGAKSKKVQIGILDRTVTPSDATYQNVYNQASKFASTYDDGDKFEEGIRKENLNKRIAPNLHAGDAAITGLDNPREMIRWAFQEADKGDLSPLYEFGNRFVIAKVTEVREEGTSTLEQVRAQVENSVRNDKKAEYLISEAGKVLQSSNSLDAVASKFNSNVNQANNAYFTSFTITGIGMEPQLTAAMVTLPLNQISKPIKGINGVYVIQVTNITEPALDADRLASRTRQEQGYSSRAGYEVFTALEKGAKVVDKRNKFY
jgi:peptidyl-prolyl cis-trans isomerase D